MPMNEPAFTSKPERVARLRANYEEGLSREQIPADRREKMDAELLAVSPAYVQQLFMNVEAAKKKNGKN